MRRKDKTFCPEDGECEVVFLIPGSQAPAWEPFLLSKAILAKLKHLTSRYSDGKMFSKQSLRPIFAFPNGCSGTRNEI
jgi:hypothetical protein